MILFKRVTESFRHIEGREWALLSLETLGVIAGILIAFWLNEWASRHSAAQQRQERLERLFEEAQTTVTMLRRDRDQLNAIVDAEKSFATALVHRGECPPEPMWRAVDTLPTYPEISVPSSVYQEIMGAGGLSEIEDTNVRRSVSYFHSRLAWTQGQNDYFRNKQSTPVSAADPRVTYDFDLSKVEPQESRYDRTALCADHKFRNGVADSARNHLLVASYHSDLARAAIFMCARIGAAVHKMCKPGDGPLTGNDALAARQAVSQQEAPRGD
ncbi:MAG: hypothetical protein QOD54_59 [Sphingomonadales bacterium]|nr:hypothetical protein [Sphingomonadales bacterium]